MISDIGREKSKFAISEKSNSKFWPIRLQQNFVWSLTLHCSPGLHLASSTRSGEGRIQLWLSLLWVMSSSRDLGYYADIEHVGITSEIGRRETSWGIVESDVIVHIAYMLIESKLSRKNMCKGHVQEWQNWEQFFGEKWLQRLWTTYKTKFWYRLDSLMFINLDALLLKRLLRYIQSTVFWNFFCTKTVNV